MIGTVGRFLAQTLCFCALVCGNVLAAPRPDLTAEQMTAIDHYVDRAMRREHVPGIAVGIYSRGQILLARGYGLANIELNVPVKAETVFQSGSMGKQFAASGDHDAGRRGKNRAGRQHCEVFSGCAAKLASDSSEKSAVPYIGALGI